MKGWSGLSMMWLVTLFVAVALLVGLGLGLGIAFAAPAHAASGYYFQNTSSRHYMTPGEPAGSQIVMGTLGEAATYTRIDFYNDGGDAFYEYKDAVTGDCLKTDVNIGEDAHPVVEEPCASGHTSDLAQDELFGDPPFPQNLWVLNNTEDSADNLMEQNDVLWVCINSGDCINLEWTLVAA